MMLKKEGGIERGETNSKSLDVSSSSIQVRMVILIYRQRENPSEWICMSCYTYVFMRIIDNVYIDKLIIYA